MPVVQRSFRMFTAGAGAAGWTEFTGGRGPAVRLRAADLQRAQRESARLRADPGSSGTSVILDIRVLIAEDFRTARRASAAVAVPPEDCVQYVGTLAGLVGLVRDVYAAGVADGVTLVPAAPDQDVEALALATLARDRALTSSGSRPLGRASAPGGSG